MTLNYASFIKNQKKSLFNKINEMIDIDTDVDYIGKRVRINNDSSYRYQAYQDGGNGEGVIINFDYEMDYYNDGDEEDDPHYFTVKWDINNHENGYRAKDLILIDDKVEPLKKIRWYKKGKFITEPTNVAETKDIIPEVGKTYIADKEIIYYDKYTQLSILTENLWKKVNKNGDRYTVLEIAYIDNKFYTGYVVRMVGKWAWYQFKNFIPEQKYGKSDR